MIIAVMEDKPDILRYLVRAGSNLNLQNQVRFTVVIGNTLSYFTIGGPHSYDDSFKK